MQEHCQSGYEYELGTGMLKVDVVWCPGGELAGTLPGVCELDASLPVFYVKESVR